MESLDITQLYTAGISEEDIRNLIVKQEGKIVVDYPMSHINSTQSYLDIIHNYLEASFIAEELGKYATNINYQEVYTSYFPICRLDIEARDINDLSEKMYELSIALSDEQEDEIAYINYLEELDDYAESLEDRVFLCSELVDGYYANLINGAYYEIDSESDDNFLKNEYLKYPERELTTLQNI